MNEKILALGGTGMLGQPSARRLQADGFHVRLLARDVEKTRQLFDETFEVVPGDVTNLSSLEKAMTGCQGVFLSIGGPVDQLSAENVAALAPRLGVGHLIYLSGSTVKEPNRWYPMTAQKLNAEKAIRECGVPYTILCPSWPMEQLPRFVREGRATVIGVLPDPWHWFAAGDLARMVSNAFQRQPARGKRLYVHGPEGIPVKDALERYCQAFHPEIESVAVMPIEAAMAMAESTGSVFIKVFAEMMDYFKKAGEPGDPTEANQILGAPTITLDEWMRQRHPQVA
ncbi:MAG: NAD(P)H-binding protein [Anaerolineales bacterium]|jgi:uncharacterized protein YbjT (DUF2867 family)